MAGKGLSPPVRLEKRAVDDAAPRENRYEIWDSELKDCGLKCPDASRSSSAIVLMAADAMHPSAWSGLALTERSDVRCQRLGRRFAFARLSGPSHRAQVEAGPEGRR